ncbi:glycoside hydrolase family 3 C-terminal domain-containing protein, partial [[Ruminococcus] lactaris]|nr:glycoside hydrolase family 3 C-terminal domain-containing protein [[Ruminococcus] lactaris]
MKKTSKKVIAVTLSASMLLGGSMTAMAATTNPDISQREIDHKTAAKNIAAQGMVLMENKNNSLPISAKKGTKVALFGQGVYNTIKGGTGSGAVNQRDNVTIQQGFENAGYDIVDTDLIDQMQALWKSDGGNTSGGGIFGSTWVNERKYADVEGAMEKVDAAAEQTDTAIYVISRNSGEFRDRTATKGDYFLSEDEEANLAVLGQKFDNVIVVLNVGGIIDTKFFDQTEGLDSMLLMSQAGMTGGDALVEVLNGTVNPSGKLTDTWPVNFDDNPSSATFANNDGNTAQEVYNDDIFVGYRYYDTFGKDVAYEFGYGGSYTKFAMSTQSVTADKDKVTVKVKVKNTGTVSGKEVAEVYFSAPEGNLDKPYQELAGYAKTDELAPGESQVLTITYDTTEM